MLIDYHVLQEKLQPKLLIITFSVTYF